MRKMSRGSIERVGKTWFGRPTSSGKRIRLGSTTELRSKAQAYAALAHYNELLHPETLEPGPAVRATAYFELFLRRHAALYRPTTRRRYESIVRNYFNAFVDQPLAAIDTAAVQAFVARLAGKRSRSTIQGIRNVLLQIVRQARRDGFACHRILTADLKLPSEARPERRARWISNGELHQVLQAAPWPWRALWAILGFAGLRIGEGLGLTWVDINFEARELSLRQACVNGQLAPLKTRTSRADLPMLPQLEAILRQYQTLWPPNPAGLLFASKRGTPLRADDVRTRRLHPLLEQLGLPKAGTHGFRHGLPSRLITAGCSPAIIQAYMRHATPSETARYTHIDGRDLRDAIEAAAQRLPSIERAA